MIEHQIRRCCVKGLILRNMAGRERMQAVCMKVVTSSSVASPNFFGRAKCYDLKRATVFYLDMPVEAQNDKIC